MPNKQLERFYLQRLQLALSDVPSGSAIEPEPPDFVFLRGGHRLGIELTTFHLGSDPGKRPHQEWQSLKNRIVHRAEHLHAEVGGPALYVGVIFHERHDLRKSDVVPFAQELTDALLAYPVPHRISDPSLTIPWGKRPKWTAGIQVNGSVDGVDKLWHADAGGWVAQITSEHVSEVVQSKASRASLARNKCDELWLVIVNDNFSLAAQAEISTEALHASYEGPFERLIWLLPHVPHAIELQLVHKAA